MQPKMRHNIPLIPRLFRVTCSYRGPGAAGSKTEFEPLFKKKKSKCAKNRVIELVFYFQQNAVRNARQQPTNSTARS